MLVNMNLLLKLCVFATLLLFPTNAEKTTDGSGTISIKMFEELATHVKSLEWKLNTVERKLANVEMELEEQKDINRKLKNELNTQTNIIAFIQNKNEELIERVDKIKLLKKPCDDSVNDGVDDSFADSAKSGIGQNFQRYVDDSKENKFRIARQEREQVAFSAYLNHDLSNLGPGHTIQYGATVLNEGNAFNVHTGIFTVPVSGVYLFSYACEDFHNHRIYVDIMVDGTSKSIVLEGQISAHSMGTNVVILRLTKGQAVWVATDANSYDDMLQQGATTFSGVFLYN